MIIFAFPIQLNGNRGGIPKDVFQTGKTISTGLKLSDVPGNDFFHLKLAQKAREFLQKEYGNIDCVSIFEFIRLKVESDPCH